MAGGIAALAWSPTGDRLALISCTGRLLLMSVDWQVLADADVSATVATPVPSRPLADESPPASASASDTPNLTPGDACISWRGDGVAFATVTRRWGMASPCVLRTWDSDGGGLHAVGEAVPGLGPAVAWQPNGRHVYGWATGSKGDRLGNAHSPPIPAPSTSPRCVLFERNGMTHGGFDLEALPLGVSVTQLTWSLDSEVLAVVLQTSSATAVRLYRRVNWHWYLKQEVAMPEGGAVVAWDEGVRSGLRLHVAGAGGALRCIDFVLDAVPSALGTAAVVDGARLLVTPLRLCVVPPPMCEVAVVCGTPIACVALSPVLSANGLIDETQGEVAAVFTSDGRLALAAAACADDWGGTVDDVHGDDPPFTDAPPEMRAIVCSTILFPPGGELGEPRAVAWLAPDCLLVLAGADMLHTLRVDYITSHTAGLVGGAVDAAVGVAASVMDTVRAPVQVLRLASLPGGGAIVLGVDGRAFWLAQPGLTLTLLTTLPSTPCPWLRALPGRAGARPSVLAVSTSGALCLNHRTVAVGVTSTAVRLGGSGGDFVLHTTSDNVLRVRTPAELVLGADTPGGLAAPARPAPQAVRQESALHTAMHKAMKGHGLKVTSGTDPCERAVEQGALLVAAPPCGEAVVLQMPRGNLETIWPRALVLAAVAHALDAADYAAAWDLTARNRLDPNIVVDYGWPAFLEHAAEFLAAVEDDQAVVDVLQALTPASVVAPGGAYAWLGSLAPQEGVGAQAESPSIIPFTEKVDAVCAALRRALTDADRAAYLRPILTSLEVQGDLETALALIKETREAELDDGGGREAVVRDPAASAITELSAPSHRLGEALGNARRLPGAVSAPTADACLKHLLLTSSFDDLWRAALGRYDLQAAYAVVVAAGRDPGEHLVDLRRWAAMDNPCLRRHAIDTHLGRHEKALQALVDAGPEHAAAALDSAARHGLLRHLVAALGPERGAERATALARHATDLQRRGLGEDAAMALLAAGDADGAVAAYASAGAWEMALALACRQGWNVERVRTLADGLVDALVASSRYADAGRVALAHVRDIDAGVAWLARAHEWRQALHAAHAVGRDDLVDTVLAPAAAEAAAAALSDARDDADRARKYLGRYQDLQARRLAAAELDVDVGAVEGMEEGADGWDAASDISGLSAYAASTSASTATTTAQPSTVGGRTPFKMTSRKHKRGKARVRQGTPDEEVALAGVLRGLSPGAARLHAAGQLAEVLVVLGHEEDARTLQLAVGDLVDAAAEACAHVAAHPPAVGAGRDAPVGGGAPESGADVHWKWDILRPVKPQ